MNQHERRLRAIKKSQLDLVNEYKAIWAKADEEERQPTEEERLDVEAKMKSIEDLNVEKAEVEATLKTLERVDDLSRELGPTAGDSGVDVPEGGKVTVGQGPTKSLGEMFVESKGYQDAIEKRKGGAQHFSTGAINLEAKGTLLSTAGSGGALAAAVPQMIPGVAEKLFQRLTVADLLAKGQATTNSLRYIVEGTATSGAAGVAEGGAKPQSTLALSTIDEPVKKVATSLVTSDEMLEDAAQVQSYINGRLSLFVDIEEERQLLLGGGTNELVGITGRAGVNTYKRGTADNNAIALFKVLNGTRGSSFLEPDAIIMNPANWQTTRLLADTAGQLYGGGPFYGPYGGPQGPASASGQLAGAAQDYLWGKPVVVTTAIGAGTAVIGSFSQAAQLFYRGGITVEASNSHEDYFTKDLVAIRAEKREALAVYRPAAFTVVSEMG